ncbi:MAG: hypothetical protein ACTSPB_13645, partial [Candidatus Thorarchaeota archaeon]
LLYKDDYFSENVTKWSGSTGITMSGSASSPVRGTNKMIATWDASQNATIWFDNAQNKNMQVDWSAYTVFKTYIWGNASFTLDYFRFYTDIDSYYEASLNVTYTTTTTEYIVPFGLFMSVGSPTRDNISWLEAGINNIENTYPVEIYFDDVRISNSDSMIIYSDCPSDGATEVYYDYGWVTTTICLDTESIQRTGSAIITFNDTLYVDDHFNTSFDIDTLYVESWNTEGRVGGTDDDTTTTEDTRTQIVVRLPIGLIIVGVIAIAILYCYETWRQNR